MDPRISFVTLGVRDLARATRFYAETLGLPQRKTPPEVAFFELGATWLALYPRHLLAEDAGIADDGQGFSGFALAHNVRSSDQVDRLLKEAAEGGGRLVKAGRKTAWGGYAGYFADPEGYLWEVAWNPHFPHV